VKDRQRYRCLDCDRQFVPLRDRTKFRKQLWREYVWHKQTLHQLAKEYDHSVQWVQRQLDKVQICPLIHQGQRVVVVTDTTFFGRGYGILVVRCPSLRKNLHCHEVRTEGIRSAYRSLKINLPYLFTYQKYSQLKIPNTTNSLDGYFSKLKQLLNVHRGTTVVRRYKIIQEILKD